MKTILLFIIFLVIQTSTGRKKTKPRDSDDSEAHDSYKNLDMSGNLRKSFFLVNAIENIYNNTICSPISALLPLGKLALGADGSTSDELLTAIGVFNIDKLKAHFKFLIASLRYLPGVRLDVASKLYISEQTKLLSKFSDNARDVFTSSAERVDFTTPVATAEKINNWVEMQTNDMIKHIISSDDISPDTSMILVNAVYFLGKWEEPFTKVQTGTFNTPNDVRRISMMTKVAHFNYTESEALDAKILKIPYNGGKASFLMVLPNTKNGLPMLLSQLKLAPEILDSALGTLITRNVHVTIPKFKIEGNIDLRFMYEQIGVKRIFNEYESELNGIVKDKTLFVSKAKQKAMIDVNEYGTEAAAASEALSNRHYIFLTFTTDSESSIYGEEPARNSIVALLIAIVASKLSYEKTMQFRADHPFLFFVLSDKQQLFAGTLVYPPVV